VKPKPTVEFNICNTVMTTKNGRPILLKGGLPGGTGGTYTGTGVALISPGWWVFNPADNAVSGGSTATGNSYQVVYRYTNSQGCFDEKSITINVFASNANDPCPGTVTDCRDGKIYQTFLTGTGTNARCWTAENLDYGTFQNANNAMADNCMHEKYCNGNSAVQCAISGGYYQWGEIMEYAENSTCQDICPPGWHVPTASEWDILITNNAGNAFAGSYLKDPLISDGFSAILAGLLYSNTSWSFTAGNLTGSMYWTASPGSPDRALSRGLNSYNNSVSSYQSSRANAFSVRCVRN
jgi:uncharacterized protein (TIGR02145 family)